MSLAGPVLGVGLMANVIWLDYNDAPEQQGTALLDTDTLRRGEIPYQSLLGLILELFLGRDRIERDLQLHLLLIELLMPIRIRVSGFEVNKGDARRIVLPYDVDRTGNKHPAASVLVFNQRLEFLLRLKRQLPEFSGIPLDVIGDNLQSLGPHVLGRVAGCVSQVEEPLIQ